MITLYAIKRTTRKYINIFMRILLNGNLMNYMQKNSLDFRTASYFFSLCASVFIW